MVKRIFDFIFSLSAFILLSPIIIVSWLLASIDTYTTGFFIQERIGQFGKPFTIYKFKTMHPKSRKISKIGKIMRNSKLDELPQLLNVLQGTMSIVGPRPDIAGYYDLLEGKDRLILNLKPGLTSLAAIKYANEDLLLAQQQDPLKYNDEIIFPDKIQMNLVYYKQQSLWLDFKIIIKTILQIFKANE